MTPRQMSEHQAIIIGLSAVVVSVDDGEPKVFIVRGAEHALSVGVHPTNEEGDALPFGPFEPEKHSTLEAGLRAYVTEQTPLHPGYVEQLYTFGNRGRYAGQAAENHRVVSIGYLALTHQARMRQTEKVFWGDWYSYFPWEDWRLGKPKIINDVIELGLKRWVALADSKEEKNHRRTRADLCFGLDDIPWDEEKVLERYELLYEARLVYESIRDKGTKVDYVLVPGRSMLYDHRRILATAMGRLRGKLKYRPVVFELVPPEFTLLHLQKTVEAIVGHSLHKQNFRRLVEGSGMVEEVSGKKSAEAGGRPAALFRFRKEIVYERPAPGMKLSPSIL
ncbi:MAG: hypothetical protein PW788_01970 [Micavibrio sp.]|nr:hypothetical protein [Micavibrio sp.]